MIIMDLFDIDFHIFTVIKFLFNLGVRFNYIFTLISKATNLSYVICIFLIVDDILCK